MTLAWTIPIGHTLYLGTALTHMRSLGDRAQAQLESVLLEASNNLKTPGKHHPCVHLAREVDELPRVEKFGWLPEVMASIQSAFASGAMDEEGVVSRVE